MNPQPSAASPLSQTSPGGDSPYRSSLGTILRENQQLLLERLDLVALEPLAAEVSNARRIFASATGRSGLVLRMAAMRLMHFGLNVHVVGDATTPAIGAGDLLLTMSGSGTTPLVLRAAQDARHAGARVAAVTTSASSPLGQAAHVVVCIPAATKHDRSVTASAQYAGTLFEQASLLTFDAIFQVLSERSGKSHEELWSRHTNLE